MHTPDTPYRAPRLEVQHPLGSETITALDAAASDPEIIDIVEAVGTVHGTLAGGDSPPPLISKLHRFGGAAFDGRALWLVGADALLRITLDGTTTRIQAPDFGTLSEHAGHPSLRVEVFRPAFRLVGGALLWLMVGTDDRGVARCLPVLHRATSQGPEWVVLTSKTRRPLGANEVTSLLVDVETGAHYLCGALDTGHGSLSVETTWRLDLASATYTRIRASERPMLSPTGAGLVDTYFSPLVRRSGLGAARAQIISEPVGGDRFRIDLRDGDGRLYSGPTPVFEVPGTLRIAGRKLFAAAGWVSPWLIAVDVFDGRNLRARLWSDIEG